MITRRSLLGAAAAFAAPRLAFGRSRECLDSDVTLYVHPDGADDADGTEDHPLATMQEARTRIRDRYDLSGAVAGIRLLDGVHTKGLVAVGSPPGQVTALHFPIIGNREHPERCVIETTNSNCLTIGASSGGFANHYIDGIEFRTRATADYSGPTCAIEMNYGSWINLGPNVIFATCEGVLGIHIWFHTGGGACGTPSGYTVRGSEDPAKRTMALHVSGSKSAQAILHNMPVKLVNKPRFACWAAAFTGAIFELDGNRYEGEGVGQRYLIDSATINAGTAREGYMPLPGDRDGESRNGGTYL
jgi:hypothetical protein